jgi:murein L,D-transpeptidase YafK
MTRTGSNVRALRRATIGALALLGLALVPRVSAAQMAFTRTSLPSDSAKALRGKADSLKAKPDTVKVKRDTEATRRIKPTFASQQQENDRVLHARLEKRFELKRQFRDRGLTYPATQTFLRIFKRERLLEVWVRTQERNEFVLFKTYPICALSGQLGPKRSEGDGQTPEGFYSINGFNPASDYHLSLRLDYPNRSDQLLSDGRSLGGNIFIHGGCRTEGCLAVNDDAIKELYWLAVEARSLGQTNIPVHIFPARLTNDELFRLTQTFDKDGELKRFWANLKTGYDFFETQHKLPLITVDKGGRYRTQAPAQPIGVPTVPTVDTATIPR